MVFDSFRRSITKVAFHLFESFIPVVIAYYLNMRMKKWEENGLIHSFQVKVIRIKKYHYKADLDFILTKFQAKDRISDFLKTISTKAGR